MNNKPKLTTTLYSAIIVFLSGILCIDRINLLIDDTFISLRYVMNIINGYGPVFNPGERIEAISNPTWVWLLSGISHLFNISNPYHIFYTSRIVGVILFMISGVLLFRFLKSLVQNESYAFFLTLIFSLNPYIATYAISGMENALVYLLLIIVLYFSRIYLDGKKIIWILLTGLSIGLLSISRPEGFIYIILYFCSIAALKLMKDNCLKKRDILFSLLISILVFIAFEFWRWTYYGEIMPLTVYAKNYISIGTIKDGLKYFLIFLVYSLGVFIFTFIYSREFSLKNIDINKKLILLIVTMFFLANSAVSVYAGGDWMPGSRLLLFTVPCFIVLLSIITSDSVSLIKNRKVFYIVISVAVFLNIYIGRDRLRPTYSGFNFTMNQNMLNDFTEVARKLKEISSPGNTVLANDIGSVSYFNPQLKFTDLYGLSDKYIAKKVKGKHFFRSSPEYFLNLNCDYVVIIGDYKTIAVDTLINKKNYSISEIKTTFIQAAVNDFVMHKDFTRKYSLVCILNNGIIFKNNDTVKN